MDYREMKRFMDKVTPLDTGCVRWDACKNKWGYGLFGFRGRVHLAHRASYIMFRGPIPEGLCVCHTCDNPWCVNADHLFVATHMENTQDKVMKGRQYKGGWAQPRGSKHYKANLTEQQVVEIVHRLSSGERPSVIAREYGVSQPIISRIKHKHSYRHVHDIIANSVS